MSAIDWHRVRALFDAVCDLAPVERAQRIDAAGLDTAERDLLDSMLCADDTPGLATDAGRHAPALLAALVHDGRPGSRVGPWRIDTLIGAGGMGRVYRASREDGRYEGTVAIKFVAEAANPAFFRHERKVLARLDHPGIARLLDAGEDARGVPYLVMEYVFGAAVDAWCRQCAAAARTRIRLVRDAARAIAHAHAQWVLHRDIKPGNLLVDGDGRIRVLDFGVAKLLDREGEDPRRTTARYFTPRYAAPEQMAGTATGVAIDQHALAVVLYELLTGVHPCAAEDGDETRLVERIIGDAAIPLRRRLAGLPHSAAPTLGGDRLRDLDAVLARALERDPAARYASVQEFADELDRVLGDHPVLARAPTTTEVLARLARRHRVAVALGALALLALVSLSGIASWQAHVAARERDAARREAARAEGIAGFLAGLFEAVKPISNQGREPSARDLLDRGRDQLAAGHGPDPTLRPALLAAVADSYRALGHYAEAQALLETAIASSERGDPRNIDWRLQLGRVHNFQSRWNDAERVLREALAETGLDAPRIAGLQRQLAVSLINQNRASDAEVAARAARAALSTLSDPPVREVVDAEMLLATLAYTRNDFEAALAAYGGIVAAQRTGGAADQDGLVTSLNNLAAIEARMDRLEDAITHYREAVERARARYGERNREVALPLLGLGNTLRATGAFDEARDALAQSRAIYLEWAGPGHPETAYASLLEAELAFLTGDPTVARERSIGIAAVLDTAAPRSIKACRAHLLQWALADPARPPTPLQQAAPACLDSDAAPPNVRLLARYVAHRKGVAATDVRALREAATGLVPRDEALRLAVLRDVPAGP